MVRMGPLAYLSSFAVKSVDKGHLLLLWFPRLPWCYHSEYISETNTLNSYLTRSSGFGLMSPTRTSHTGALKFATKFHLYLILLDWTLKGNAWEWGRWKRKGGLPPLSLFAPVLLFRIECPPLPLPSPSFGTRHICRNVAQALHGSS